MKNYKHLLIAIDLHPNLDETVIEHGLSIAREYEAKVTLLHTIEHVNAYGVAQAYPTVMEIEEQMQQEAQQSLKQLCDKYAYSQAEVSVEIGSPKVVILDKAKELNVDLIVLGSHGRHGLQVLLGSTANAVLHHAPCDVLAVRMQS